MLISLIVTNGENFKEIEEPSLTALGGDLDWNDPNIKLFKKLKSGLELVFLPHFLHNF